MISWSDAQAIIKAQAPKMPICSTKLADALSMVLAEDIHAISHLPPFDNSAMDGYAINAAKTKSAHADNPLLLKISHAVFAGDSLHADLPADSAVRIMTGAKVPQAFNAVIPFEAATIDGDMLIIDAPIPACQNIRKQGSDIQKGTMLIAKGTRLNAYHLSLLGAQGIGSVTVYSKPKIALIITGDEVTQENSAQGTIADANGPFLQAAITQAGALLHSCHHVGDDTKTFQALIAELKEAEVELIISTGAVSMGEKDFIPAEILNEGGKIHFHKIYQRPGKPLLFAELSNGTHWFGLPGNPVATQASFIFSVQNWLAAAMGTEAVGFEKAIFKGDFTKKKGFVHFLRGKYYSDEAGRLMVHLPDGQASYQLKNWDKSNCWIMAAADTKTLTDNIIVDIYRI